MRKILMVVLAVTLLMVLAITPVAAKPAQFVGLDYDGDGVLDCQYMVSEKHTKGTWSMKVVYFSFDWEYLGEELWTDYWGIMEDTFAPWTYPFPA